VSKRFSVPKPGRPVDVRERLRDIRNTCDLCIRALHHTPPTNLPPGSYFRRALEVALRRSAENNIYLLDLIDHLMEERYVDFWRAIQESAKPIQDGPEWLKAGITFNPKVYDMYEPELPIPLTRKTDEDS